MSEMPPPTPFEVGDSVRVKKGTKDPDNPEWNIEGWQGRVVEVRTEDPFTILVEWDSVTLKHMPAAIIEACETEGLDWARFYFFPSDVEEVLPRDTEADVKEAQDKLHDQYCWVSLGAEGRRIQHVLAGIDPADEIAILRAWEIYLTEKMTFPFDAAIAEFQDYGRLRQGDEVRVVGIVEVDDHYGLIASIQRAGTSYHLPLADLEARDQRSSNYQPLRDYSIWFANR